LTVGWSAAAADAPQGAGGSPSDAEQTQRGKALYARLCSHCHGFGMVNAGNVVPDLREFPKDDEQRFIDTVERGKNNRMPPWGDVLSFEEIEELWAYVRTGGKS
jgi:mono/diheme cytochrome c family protein